MNYSALALGLVFGAIAMPFLAQAKKESDPQQKRNKGFAAVLFLIAAAAFVAAFAFSVFRSVGQ